MSYLELAQDAGASMVIATCSSIGPAADIGRSMADTTVLRVDEPMAEKAVACGQKIGAAATLRTILTPTASLIERPGKKKEAIRVAARMAWTRSLASKFSS